MQEIIINKDKENNKTIAIVENGTWAPSAARTMKFITRNAS